MLHTISHILHLKGIRRYVCIFLVNSVLRGTNPRYFEAKRCLLNAAGLELGEGTKVVGPIFVQGHLKTGRDCWLGKNLVVNGDGFVTLGDNCDVGPEVRFQTGGHKIGSADRRAGEGVVYSIAVGSGCWICAGSDLIGGSNVADSTVVAARACVVGDIPESVLCGGVPARVIKKLR